MAPHPANCISFTISSAIANSSSYSKNCRGGAFNLNSSTISNGQVDVIWTEMVSIKISQFTVLDDLLHLHDFNSKSRIANGKG
mmetsp:Transcript_23981/g.36543  ORF Transcript_23981/g.36543 Transcript_23981/m.36543 type:complete len:83 (+) Transcript_23981:124-372(+)